MEGKAREGKGSRTRLAECPSFKGKVFGSNPNVSKVKKERKKEREVKKVRQSKFRAEALKESLPCRTTKFSSTSHLPTFPPSQLPKSLSMKMIRRN